MKKILSLIVISFSVLFIISGCSINIEKDQDKKLQEQIGLLQEQLSGLQQKVNSLETENTELKKKTTTVQPKRTIIPTQPKEMDNCPNGDNTISRYDGDCCDGENEIYIDGKCRSKV